MKIIEYYSNNSGGSDWLDKEDWGKLEKAGWKLFGFDDFVYKNGGHDIDIDGLPKRISDRSKPKRPKYAFKLFNSLKDAINEFENITGQDSEEIGCECCGQPHNFHELSVTPASQDNE